MEMNFQTFIFFAILTLASAKPTFDVIAGVLHELAEDILKPTYEQRPRHQQPYPYQQNGYVSGGYAQNGYPQSAYPNHYNTVNRPAGAGYGYGPAGVPEARPYYENGYDRQGPYSDTGFQSPPLTYGPNSYGSEPGYGYQQPAYSYPTREQNAYPRQRY